MKKKFSAQLLSLHPILSWIRTHLETTPIPKVEIARMEIAFEEALVNIFSYAYPNGAGTIEVSIHLESEEYVEIIFKDQGLPFNPLQYKKNTPSLTRVEAIKEGGLGILFMQKFMDKIEYRREKNANIISLRKKYFRK